MSISPFAPESFPELPAIDGLEMATAEAGIKYEGRTDVWVLHCSGKSAVAGVFTKNVCPGAPVEWSRQALYLQVCDTSLVIVNSGNANVFGGQKSRDAVEHTAKEAARIFDVWENNIQISSTGVIGEPLDASKITATFPTMKFVANGWEDAARAIMTTDTYPKGATATCEIDGVAVRLNGIAKGSGMIAPDMATMLAYVGTDANILQEALQVMLDRAVGSTFNSITVDSDTSTSDTLLVIASRTANTKRISDPDDPRAADFCNALHTVLEDLALQVVKDGEGITKYIRVEVSGAVSDASAHRVGLAVANSPLVKTAVAGEDANWGRIVMAVGKAGEPAERDLLTVCLGPHVLAEKGELAAGYTESHGAAYMKNDEIVIGVDLGMGEGKAAVHTCDLTHGYISINADYRS